MPREPLPDDVRRYIVTSVASVPYLEAMLLLRNEPDQPWDVSRVARRLYMDEQRAGELLTLLRQSGVLRVVEEQPPAYSYAPATDELRQMIDRVANAYAANLVEVTHLIHSTMDRKAQQIADAFRFRKDN
jgi:hypothetical protein